MFSLIELFKKQHNLSLAVNVLRDGLHRAPPLIPPLPLLTALATPLEMTANVQELHLLITTLLESKTSVSEGRAVRGSVSEDRGCWVRTEDVV